MSHVVQIHTQVRDPVAMEAACRRLAWPAPTYGATRLFSAEATGWRVQLPDWRYPVVCDTALGVIHYDNFEGRWGDPRHLQRYLQAYAVEKARLEARRAGHTVLEQTLSDGSVKLTIQVGAAA